MRHRLIVSSVLAASVSGFSCGGDDAARRQAVFWFALSTGQGATCSSVSAFELPETARETLIGTTGQGDRISDSGEYTIDCSVRPVAGTPGSYNVSLSMSTGGEIGYFSASGVVSETSSDIDVDFQTTSFALEQDGCTATIEEVKPGAVWLRNLSCPALRDERSIGIECVGTGGLIFESCGR